MMWRTISCATSHLCSAYSSPPPERRTLTQTTGDTNTCHSFLVKDIHYNHTWTGSWQRFSHSLEHTIWYFTILETLNCLLTFIFGSNVNTERPKIPQALMRLLMVTWNVNHVKFVGILNIPHSSIQFCRLRPDELNYRSSFKTHSPHMQSSCLQNNYEGEIQFYKSIVIRYCCCRVEIGSASLRLACCRQYHVVACTLARA